MLSALLEEIVNSAAGLHGSGTFSPIALRALLRHIQSLGSIEHSVETGSGASTLVLSHLSRHHTTFTVDSGSSVWKTYADPRSFVPKT